MAYVMTVDQRRSSRSPDLVEQALAQLAAVPTILPFERTAGDELQGVLADPVSVVDAILMPREGRSAGTSASASARSSSRCRPRAAPVADRPSPGPGRPSRPRSAGRSTWRSGRRRRHRRRAGGRRPDPAGGRGRAAQPRGLAGDRPGRQRPVPRRGRRQAGRQPTGRGPAAGDRPAPAGTQRPHRGRPALLALAEGTEPARRCRRDRRRHLRAAPPGPAPLAAGWRPRVLTGSTPARCSPRALYALEPRRWPPAAST